MTYKRTCKDCGNTVRYTEEWNQVVKDSNYKSNVSNCYVHCSNGDVSF